MRDDYTCIYNAGISCYTHGNEKMCGKCGWNPAVDEKRKAERQEEQEMKRTYEWESLRVKLDYGAFLPARAHKDDAGLDIYSPTDAVVPARGSCVIDTGVHVELPSGVCGLLVSKSGLNVKSGITSEGLIDCGYTGSIVVKLYNNSDEEYTVGTGDKISQLVLLRYLSLRPVRVDRIDGGERGENGFGSTGR